MKSLTDEEMDKHFLITQCFVTHQGDRAISVTVIGFTGSIILSLWCPSFAPKFHLRERLQKAWSAFLYGHVPYDFPVTLDIYEAKEIAKHLVEAAERLESRFDKNT